MDANDLIILPIASLQRIATRADWLSNTYFAVDNETTGTKKLAVDILVTILNNFAPEFQTDVACVVGRCYWNEGILYRCVVAHSGVWVASHFVEVSIDDIKQTVAYLLTNVATESDLIASNFIALSGSNGQLKLPGDAIAPRSVQNNIVQSIAPAFDPVSGGPNGDGSYPAGFRVMYEGLLYEFFADHATGPWLGDTDAQKVNENDALYHARSGHGHTNGSTPVHIIRAPVKTGHIYAVVLRSAWNVSSIPDGTNVLYVQYNFSAGALQVKKEDFSANKLAYIFTAAQDNRINVSCRGNAGEYVEITLVDVTFSKGLHTKNQYLNFVSVYSGNVVMNGSTEVFADNTNIPLKKGHTYTFTTENAWDITDIANNDRVMFVQKSDGSSILTELTKVNAVGLDYFILSITPTEDVSVRVGFRGAVGAVCSFNVTDVSNINLYKKEQYLDFVSIYSGKVVMNGSTAVFADNARIPLKKGHTYTFTTENAWDITGITNSDRVMFIQKSDGSSVLEGITKANAVGLDYFIISITPTEDVSVRVGFRGAVGAVGAFNITDVSNVDLYKKEQYLDFVSIYSGKVVMNGSTAVFADNARIPLKKGHTYTFTTENAWDITGITNSDRVMFIQKSDGSSVLEGITKANAVGLDYFVLSITPTEDVSVRVGFRGAVGAVGTFNVTDVSNIGISPINTELAPSISFFESIGVIGASFESGVVYKNSSTSMGANYPKSWPQILAREKGIDVTNFSYGGADSHTWLTNSSYGLPAMNAASAKELYILNLGSNDSYHYGNDYIGTSADIGTDADTFFGNMSKIIDAVQTKAPNARIIIAEIRTNTEGSTANYNAAIRELATHYSLPTVVPYEDPFYSTETYKTFVGGHPLYMGYAGMAKAWCRMVEKCMNNNLNYFNHIPE